MNIRSVIGFPRETILEPRFSLDPSDLSLCAMTQQRNWTRKIVNTLYKNVLGFVSKCKASSLTVLSSFLFKDFIFIYQTVGEEVRVSLFSKIVRTQTPVKD